MRALPLVVGLLVVGVDSVLRGQVAGIPDEPLATVRELAAAIDAADSARLAAVFHPAAEVTAVNAIDGGVELVSASSPQLVAQLGQLGAHVADERLGRADVRVDGELASVWVPYRFYTGGSFSHCGTNAFTLVREPDGPWLILRATYTRRTVDCPPLTDSLALVALDSLLDAWHAAAATADSAAFFGTMSPDGVYLGTDASERWLRDEMADWAAPFFRRDTAWAFTPRRRYWTLGDDGQTAWFDEHLDSWMGVVRGSGVLTRTPASHRANGADPAASDAWELRRYNLALAVPNERMDAVRMAIDSTAAPR